MATISVPITSRFRYTRVFFTNGLYRYGTYVPPPSFETVQAGNYSSYSVTASDIGFLDRIAVRFYGPGNESMWWALCRVNGIIDPEVDVWPGRKLKIPPREQVVQFIGGS